MIKKYDNNLYYEMADKANELKQKLYILETEQEFEKQAFEYEKKEIEVPIYNEEGEIIGYEKQLVDDLDKPIMIEEIDPETGETILVHKYHLETYTDTVAELVIADDGYYICFDGNSTDGTVNPNFEEYKKQKFLKDFFPSSLGYVRRKVSMQTGETKDFLADILPILQVGIPILTYSEEGEQNKVLVTEEFINECKQQVIKDFYGA